MMGRMRVFSCVSNWPMSFYQKIVYQVVPNIAQLAEDIIEKFPRVINSYRDIGKHYDFLTLTLTLTHNFSLCDSKMMNIATHIQWQKFS